MKERAWSVAVSRIGSAESWNSGRRPSKAAEGKPVMCRANARLSELHGEQRRLANHEMRGRKRCTEVAWPDNVGKAGAAARFRERPGP